MGQNILFHVGKNGDNQAWFAAAYRSGYRLGSNQLLGETTERIVAQFSLEISADDLVRFSMDGHTLKELFFPIDGIPIVAILSWGDEYEYSCKVRDLTLHV